MLCLLCNSDDDGTEGEDDDDDDDDDALEIGQVIILWLMFKKTSL